MMPQESHEACPSCDRTFIMLSHLQAFDFTSKSRSNSFSSATVKQLVHRAEDEILECDEEIKKLRSKIFVLETMQGNLKNHVTDMKSLQSPWRKVPREVLAEIFLHLDMTIFISSYSIVPQTMVASVCANWQSVVLSTPALWCGFELWSQNKNTQVQLNVLNRLLPLSKNHPLRISIGQNRSSGESLPDAVVALVEHSSRWQDLTTRLSPALQTTLFNAIHGRIPMLVHLRLDLTNYGQNIAEHFGDGLDVFETAPRFKFVSLKEGEGVNLRLPWSQLEYITLHNRLATNLLQTLKRSPHLISAVVLYPLPSGPVDGIVESRISSLDLFLATDRNIAACVTLFQHLRLSWLSEISLDILSTTLKIALSPLDSFVQMLRSSGCKLKIFKLRIYDIPLNAFTSLLSHLPYLEELVLYFYSGRPLVINELIRTLILNEAPGTGPLPLLRSIKITVSQVRDLTDDILLSLILSRRNAIEDLTSGPLKEVSLKFYNYLFGFPFIESMKHLASSGLSAVLVGSDGTVVV